MDLRVRFESGAQGKYIKLFGIEDALKMIYIFFFKTNTLIKAQSFLLIQKPQNASKRFGEDVSIVFYSCIYTQKA